MLNLLSNAVKFTNSGGSVFVNIFDKGSNVCIQVRDTGKGIPIHRQNDIFQRFCQIEPTFTKLSEGSGIGLSLVKAFVEMHEGSITVESELDKGTTFTIYLPSKLNKEDTIKPQEFFNRQNRVEQMQLEFSDIYSTSVG
jgi:signal transduction histidine kinase